MSSVGLGLVLLALAASALPLWLLRQPVAQRACDWLVAPDRLRAPLVRNTLIVTTLRVVLFVALFVAGASGDVGIVLAMVASHVAGVHLVYLVRRPALAHVDDALVRDGSFSVVAFAVRRHGLNAGIRLLACMLVLVALAALVAVEAIALRWSYELLLPGAPLPAWASVAALVLAAAIQATASGHAAALHAAQLQFGLQYVGLLGSTVVLLYAQAATLVPLGRADALMLAIGTAACLAMLVDRRSRYVDSDPSRPAGLTQAGRPPLASRVLRRAATLTNQIVSMLAVFAIVIAGMALYGAWSQGLRGTPPSGGGLPSWGVAVLGLVLLLHPLVDLAVWQQVAALRIRAGPADLPEEEAEQRVRSTFRAQALQTAALGLLMGMLGSLAATVTGLRDTATLSAAASRLTALDADLGGWLLPLGALTLIACALAGMAAQFSAMLCTLRLDLRVGVGFGSVRGEASYRRRARYAVLLVASVVAALAVLVPFPESWR